jgi:hypothetical protein
VLAAVGKTVLISDYFEYYRLAAYLARYTSYPIGITLGVASLRDLFNEQYYSGLEGGILEAFGKLFTKDLRIYVYPLRETQTGELVTVENVELSPAIRSLYAHLVDHGRVRQLKRFDETVLHIFSRDVLKRIAAGDMSWQGMVPEAVAKIIQAKRFFGYRPTDERVSA